MQHLVYPLKLLDLTLWVERSHLPEVVTARNFIFLTEKEAQFTEAHRQQLNKILDFLGLQNYQLIYQGASFDLSAAQFVLSFGKQDLPKNACVTLAISDMLTNPSCKRQVLNDLKPIKDQIAAAS